MRCFIGMFLNDQIRDQLSPILNNEHYPKHLRLIEERLWHLTLVFLGEVEETRIKDIIHVCNRYNQSPGSIIIDHLETFPQPTPRMLVAGGSPQPIERWKLLTSMMQSDLAGIAQHMDTKPWTAHVTLARGEKTSALAKWDIPIGPFTWKPKAFHLVQSVKGSDIPVYRNIHEFKFV